MQSEQIGQLAAAMAKAQAKMKNPVFDSKNPAFGSGFTSLAGVRNEVIPAYSSEDIAVIQDVSTTESGVSCITILIHKSGEFMSFGPLVIPTAKRDAWTIAGATTYAKRISLQAVAVVVGDEDDDGTAAQTPAHRGDRSGRPDTSAVPAEEVSQYVEGFTNALLDANAAKVMDLHNELRTQAELYTAVSDRLSSKQRTDLRKIITENKAAA